MTAVVNMLCAVAAMSAAAFSVSGDAVRDFTSRVAESRVTFDYRYETVGAKVNVSGGGSITLQDNRYFIEGDGMRVWCDGASVWTFDAAANEAVIEPSDSANGLAADPILILLSCDRTYSWDGAGEAAEFGGVPCRMYVLSAKGGAQFSEVRLFLAEGALVGAVLRSGNVKMTFTVSSFRFLPKGSSDIFTPAPFPSGCVVTDLR